MKPLVFVGPSLSHRKCSQLLHADLLPPVRRGDLCSIAPGRVVAIIDGELPPDDFLPGCEVSDALDRRVALYGAASVGAWHAAAFSTQGMHGVGWVYDQYVAGKIASFDEIAAIYDPLYLRNLSVPLVNIRFWLDGLVAASRVTPDDARTALAELRQLPVFDRDIVSIKKCLREVLHQSPVQKELETMTAFPDIKRKDARTL
jgi:TfuA protein